MAMLLMNHRLQLQAPGEPETPPTVPPEEPGESPPEMPPDTPREFPREMQTAGPGVRMQS